jgi:HEAT repeat protein
MAATVKLLASSFAVLLSTGLAVQQPRIVNGRVTAQPAAAPFVQSFRTLVAAQAGIAWIGYSVPVVDGERLMCCDGSSYSISNRSVDPGGFGACRLEPSSSVEPDAGNRPRAAAGAGGAQGTVKLEGSDRMVVLYRIAERRVERIRIFSEDCALDAGGRPVQWLDNVRPADSVGLLESFALANGDGGSLVVTNVIGRSPIVDGAVTAIALHGDPAADAALERFVATSQPESLRKKVTFWLGNARGRRGFDTLRRMLRDDPSIEVRKGAVFGLSQSSVPEMFDALSSVARTDPEPRLRSEALFWLAQKGDSRAAQVITDALEKDASQEVRKKAVFALSQLKSDAGVAALIQAARSNPDEATRAEAIFWLAQKAGRRAIEAITERIEQDPATEVKKKAVFALSQLPNDEGVPLLINVARNNSNAVVRKQAMFWLGQSKDPRAVEFFVQILKQ